MSDLPCGVGGGVLDMAMEEMPLWDLRNAHFATFAKGDLQLFCVAALLMQLF